MPSLDEVISTVESYRNDMVDALTELLRIPAIGPENGGEGEFERARFVRELAERCGFEDIEMYDALDERVRLRLRPNVVVKKKGISDQTVWIVSHMDTVTPGNLDAWTYPPFSPKVMENKLFGLGAESYTVGSHEFYLAYAVGNRKLLCLDAGHFHPTETIADKISSVLLYLDEILLSGAGYTANIPTISSELTLRGAGADEAVARPRQVALQQPQCVGVVVNHQHRHLFSRR